MLESLGEIFERVAIIATCFLFAAVIFVIIRDYLVDGEDDE